MKRDGITQLGICGRDASPLQTERRCIGAIHFETIFRRIAVSSSPDHAESWLLPNNSHPESRSALSESNTPNSQERITWLKRNGLTRSVTNQSLANQNCVGYFDSC